MEQKEQKQQKLDQQDKEEDDEIEERKIAIGIAISLFLILGILPFATMMGTDELYMDTGCFLIERINFVIRHDWKILLLVFFMTMIVEFLLAIMTVDDEIWELNKTEQLISVIEITLIVVFIFLMILAIGSNPNA